MGAIFADVKSAFPSVHHPRMLRSLEEQGFHPELLNIIHSFLNGRETFLSFNGFKSTSFSLNHGLPQGSPLSPLLYLLYNNTLLTLSDTIPHSTSLGFVDDVILMTAATDQHELTSKTQHLANTQITWAGRHGAIFDTNKTKWMIFNPRESTMTQTITFGDRKDLKPVSDTKWLGVTLDSRLTFRKHREDVIAKRKKRAHFLTSLSNTKWGIPPTLFKTLITSTVHAATDYAAAAWINLPVPKYFTEQLTTIDSICATRALGALRNSPQVFLRHDLSLKRPDIRITARIMGSIAIIAAKPPTQPLYHMYQHAKETKPQSHKGPLQAYFQSTYADVFRVFHSIHQPDPSIPLPPTPNFATLIRPDKESAIKSIQALKASNVQTIVYSDGSRIEKKNTAAAAWCENTKHFNSTQLGKATEYGIFEAEFVGFILALKIAKHSFSHTTRQITIILDNQGVVRDMATKKTSSHALNHKIDAIKVINDIHDLAPAINVTLRWCPGHKGIVGNEKAEVLATTAAKKKLNEGHQDKPTLTSFRAAIKAWAEDANISSFT